jgi:hypothetical protein
LELYEKLNNNDLYQNASYNENSESGEKHTQAMNIIANTLLNMDEFLMKN